MLLLVRHAGQLERSANRKSGLLLLELEEDVVTKLSAGFCLACILMSSGCEEQKRAIVSISGSETIGSTVANYYTTSDRVFLIIWRNFRPAETGGWHGGSSVSSSAAKTDIQGDYTTTDGRGFRWSCETKDGRSGTVIIGEVRYDLAQGGVFLVSDVQGTPTVSQLSCEVGGTVPIRPALEFLADSDVRIGNFIGLVAAED